MRSGGESRARPTKTSRNQRVLTKRQFEALDLHNAVTRRMEIDYLARTATIELDWCREETPSDRVPGRLLFEGVRTACQAYDVGTKPRAVRGFTGNTWNAGLNHGDGMSHISLMTGHIAIGAKKVRAEMLKRRTPVRRRESSGLILNQHRAGTFNLHDALIKRATVDFDARTITFDFDYYPSAQTSKRAPGHLRFDGVLRATEISDLDRLCRPSNLSAGNVEDWSWQRSNAGGTTHVFLIDGQIVVSARSARFRAR